MRGKQRTYRKKPLVVFQTGTHTYEPSSGETRYRVVAPTVEGGRAFIEFDDEDAARLTPAASTRHCPDVARWPLPRHHRRSANWHSVTSPACGECRFVTRNDRRG